MSNININFNDFTWQLIIATLGGAFAVFSLIYNDYYIYYGLTTFAFGVSAHIMYLFFSWVFNKKGTESKWYWLTHLSNAIFAVAWIKVLVFIY